MPVKITKKNFIQLSHIISTFLVWTTLIITWVFCQCFRLLIWLGKKQFAEKQQLRAGRGGSGGEGVKHQALLINSSQKYQLPIYYLYTMGQLELAWWSNLPQLLFLVFVELLCEHSGGCSCASPESISGLLFPAGQKYQVALRV